MLTLKRNSYEYIYKVLNPKWCKNNVNDFEKFVCAKSRLVLFEKLRKELIDNNIDSVEQYFESINFAPISSCYSEPLFIINRSDPDAFHFYIPVMNLYGYDRIVRGIKLDNIPEGFYNYETYKAIIKNINSRNELTVGDDTVYLKYFDILSKSKYTNICDYKEPINKIIKYSIHCPMNFDVFKNNGLTKKYLDFFNELYDVKDCHAFNEKQLFELNLKAFDKKNREVKIFENFTVQDSKSTINCVSIIKEPPTKENQMVNNMDNAKMTNVVKGAGIGTFTTLLDAAKQDIQVGAWRAAAQHAVKLSKEPMLAYIKRKFGSISETFIIKALETDIGEAGYAYILGVALEMALQFQPNISSNKMVRLSTELRQYGTYKASFVLMEFVAGPIRELITEFAKSLPNDIESKELNNITE